MLGCSRARILYNVFGFKFEGVNVQECSDVKNLSLCVRCQDVSVLKH